MKNILTLSVFVKHTTKSPESQEKSSKKAEKAAFVP